MRTIPSVAHLSDQQLLAEIKTLAGHERRATAALVASLVELDARRLYLREGCSSLFTYCTQVLHLSEHASYGRIEAARAARRFPVILDLLADGAVTLTAICLLAPHLTPDNHQGVLAAVRHKSKRDVELLVATLRPQPPIRSSIRRMPALRPPDARPTLSNRGADALLAPLAEAAGGSAQVETPVAGPQPSKQPAVIAPLAPERYKVQFTVSGATYEKLRRAQDLMRHTVPDGDPAAIFDRALTLLVSELEKAKFAATARPRAARPSAVDSRHITATVKREVWQRDAGQCAFVGTNGRCTERGFLEFHHVVAFADGGQTVAGNLELRCRAHNVYEAEQRFGSLFVRDDRARYSVPTTRADRGLHQILSHVPTREGTPLNGACQSQECVPPDHFVRTSSAAPEARDLNRTRPCRALASLAFCSHQRFRFSFNLCCFRWSHSLLRFWRDAKPELAQTSASRSLLGPDRAGRTEICWADSV